MYTSRQFKILISTLALIVICGCDKNGVTWIRHENKEANFQILFPNGGFEYDTIKSFIASHPLTTKMVISEVERIDDSNAFFVSYAIDTASTFNLLKVAKYLHQNGLENDTVREVVRRREETFKGCQSLEYWTKVDRGICMRQFYFAKNNILFTITIIRKRIELLDDYYSKKFFNSFEFIEVNSK